MFSNPFLFSLSNIFCAKSPNCCLNSRDFNLKFYSSMTAASEKKIFPEIQSVCGIYAILDCNQNVVYSQECTIGQALNLSGLVIPIWLVIRAPSVIFRKL